MNKIILVIILISSLTTVNGQNINWNGIDSNTSSIAYFNIGYDFGMTAQVGFAKQLKTKKTILLTADYSVPMGRNLQDDFKLRLGGQIVIFEKNNFMASAKVYSVFRRHQTSLVRMINFGSEFGAVVGYYKSNWHLAGEFGFDKSIITQLEHSDAMRDNYPNITDGWYIPSGGHFYYGLQGSKSIGRKLEVSLKMGATNAQFKDQNALLPVYASLGFIWKFS